MNHLSLNCQFHEIKKIKPLQKETLIFFSLQTDVLYFNYFELSLFHVHIFTAQVYLVILSKVKFLLHSHVYSSTWFDKNCSRLVSFDTSLTVEL